MSDTATPDAPWLAPFPRRFVDPTLTVTGYDDIEPLYKSLIAFPVESVDDLIEWIGAWSEVHSVVDEFTTRAYVAMTCRTDDEGAKAAYLAIVREVQPKTTEWENMLDDKFLTSPYRSLLPADRYERFDRMTAVSKELFAEKNIPLATRLSELAQRYQELSGGLTATFEGEERTLQQMGVFLKDADRSRREAAYRTIYERRLAEKEGFETIFDEMVKLRHELAQNLALPDYRAYAYRSKLRDYTPQDAVVFHVAIEKTVVPLLRKIHLRRKEEMGVDALKPWDLSCDPQGRPPLKPFTGGDALFDGVAAVFGRMDRRLADYFTSIGFSMDLESRKGKAPGGYQTTYEEARIPFIFTNAVGVADDVNTLLHEAGHAFHTLAARNQDLTWYRHAGMEFCEVASMSMELIGGHFLDPFYASAEEIARVNREKFEDVVALFASVAMIDGFQNWIYTNPNHTRQARSDAWLALMERFGGGVVDFADVPEAARRHQWHRILHIFEVPFYYIEYAIAQLGALQVWGRYKQAPTKALDDYLAGLALGGSRAPHELFAAAGIRFDFTEKTLGGLMEMVADELAL
jgi:oligoendopeptidase F